MKLLKKIYLKGLSFFRPDFCPRCIKGDMFPYTETNTYKDLGVDSDEIAQLITYEKCNKCGYRIDRVTIGYIEGGF